MDFSRPGKPTDNAFAEAFNSRVRAELLSANWFFSLADARAKSEAWRREYNTLRPHGSLGWKTPMEQAQALLGIPPPELRNQPDSHNWRSRVGVRTNHPRTLVMAG